jgi:NADPH:quinone reductase-like Zn-dependent oxidoreductase
MGLPTTMTAAVTVGHGGPEQIEIRHDYPCPRLGAGEVLVEVAAAAVNNTDIWSREGRYGTATDADAVVGWRGVPLDFPRIQGMDVTGEVVGVGEGVQGSWLSRRVLVDPAFEYTGMFPTSIIGSEVDGGFAQYHVCHERQLCDVTGSPLTDAQLACLPCAYGTALGMLNRAACAAAERILVTGASGGVGLAAVQLLAARGCVVVARTSAPHRELVEGSGAAEISLRGVDDLSQLAPVDAVVDVVGGEEFAMAVDRLRAGGRLVTAGAIAGPVVALDLRRLYLLQRTLIGSTMHTPADFRQLAGFAVAGSVSPVVAGTYLLEEIADAQARFVSGNFVGKLVFEPHGTAK